MKKFSIFSLLLCIISYTIQAMDPRNNAPYGRFPEQRLPIDVQRNLSHAQQAQQSLTQQQASQVQPIRQGTIESTNPGFQAQSSNLQPMHMRQHYEMGPTPREFRQALEYLTFQALLTAQNYEDFQETINRANITHVDVLSLLNDGTQYNNEQRLDPDFIERYIQHNILARHIYNKNFKIVDFIINNYGPQGLRLNPYHVAIAYQNGNPLIAQYYFNLLNIDSYAPQQIYALLLDYPKLIYALPLRTLKTLDSNSLINSFLENNHAKEALFLALTLKSQILLFQVLTHQPYVKLDAFDGIWNKNKYYAHIPILWYLIVLAESEDEALPLISLLFSSHSATTLNLNDQTTKGQTALKQAQEKGFKKIEDLLKLYIFRD